MPPSPTPHARRRRRESSARLPARPYDNVACSGVSPSDWAGSHRYVIKLDGDLTQKLLLKSYTRRAL